MSFIKEHKIIIIFYLLIICFTYLLTIRVENLESKEDYYNYSENVAMNFID